MAAGDIALRVLVTGSTENVMSAFSAMSSGMLSAFGMMGSGAKEIGMALGNIGSSAIAGIGAAMTASRGLMTGLEEVAPAVIADGEYLASLGAQAFTTGVGFDGMAASSAAADVALAGTGVEAEAAAAGLDTAAVSEASLAAGAGTLVAGLFALAGILALIAVVVVAALGIAGVKAAGDFQQGMARLVTGAGDVTDNMQVMGQAILKVSTDTGVASGKLIDAEYQILSTGERGATALNTLAVAARGAQIEQANVVDVTKALTTAMVDYGTKQFNATQFMNGYIVAVQRGKITLQELSNALGPILPVAKAMGVSFANMAAAMSTMTSAGIPAARAATSLRFLLQSMEVPTHKAALAMKQWGVDSTAVANEMKVSLPGALQMVYNAAKKAGPEGSVPFNRAVSDMVGGQRSLQAFLALTGTHLKTFKDNSTAVSDAMKKSKDAVLGWDLAQKNLNIQVDRGKAAMQALFVNIGTALLPVITQIASKVIPVIAAFADWVIKSHLVENVIKALGVVFSTMGAILTPVIGVFMKFIGILGQVINWVAHNEMAMTALKYVLIAIGAILAAVFIVVLAAVVVILAAVAIAIGIVVGAIMLVITIVRNWGNIGNWFMNIWRAIGAWLVSAWGAIGAFFVGIWNGIKAAAVSIWTAIVNWIKSVVGAIGAWFVGLWNGIKSTAVSIWNAIVSGIQGIISGVVNWLKSTWQNAVTTVVGWFSWLYAHNYYFQALVDFIRNVVGAVISWLTGAWQNTVNWIVNAWNWLKNTAVAVWNAIVTFITSVVNNVVTFLVGVWTTVTGWISAKWNWLKAEASALWAAMTALIQQKVSQAQAFIVSVWNNVVSTLQGIWNNIVKGVTTAWTNISNVFRSAWGTYVSGPLNSLWNSITSAFSGFASQAVQFGINIINGFINGIRSMIGAAGQAAQDVIANVKSFLGFHSPAEKGEGRYIIEWGSGMIDGFITGMKAAQPRLQATLNGMIGAPGYGIGTAGGGNSFALTGGSAASGQGTMNLTIMMDGREITNVVGVRMARELRVQANVKK